MGQIVFVGLGLHDDEGVSLHGLEEIRTANNVFIELYTSLMPSFSLQRLEEISGKRIAVLTREELEERNGEIILETSRTGKTVLLVPGDPLIATTHVTLRIRAEKHGIKTRIIHGASILSAAIGLSGLHNYKFGKSVTIPFPDETSSETPYAIIAQNKKLGLHTLCFLDFKAVERRFLSIREGLDALLNVEARSKKKAVLMDTLVVGIARAGSNDPEVKAGCIKDILNHDYGGPPYSVIFPGRFHFMEAEALIVLAGAPEKLRMIAE